MTSQTSDSDCLFCGIVGGAVSSTMVAEDERTVTFMDINPGTAGHVLVVPRRHSRDLLDIAPEDLAACARAAQLAARRAVDRLGAGGVNLLNCSGAAAWQTVFHFHLHVVPRYADDRLELPWVPTPGDADEIAEAASRLTSS